MTDAALLERCRRGDRDAFAVLVERHQDSLYRMALRLLGRPEDAADVVQETFLRAFLKPPRPSGESARPWLIRVAVNAAHDVQRRRARRPADPLEGPDGVVLDLPDPTAGPEAGAEARDRGRRLRDALVALPMEFRACVVLRDVEDLAYEEIASTLRVPLGTVKSRIARGRALLATALADLRTESRSA